MKNELGRAFRFIFFCHPERGPMAIGRRFINISLPEKQAEMPLQSLTQYCCLIITGGLIL